MGVIPSLEIKDIGLLKELYKLCPQLELSPIWGPICSYSHCLCQNIAEWNYIGINFILGVTDAQILGTLQLE